MKNSFSILIVILFLISNSCKDQSFDSLENNLFETSYNILPIAFEENIGQATERFDFVANAQGHKICFGDNVIEFYMEKNGVDIKTFTMKLINSNNTRALEGENNLFGKSNYFVGNDKSKWLRNISNYSRLKYNNVYDRIDLIFYGNNKKLEYDFEISPNGNPDDIKILFDGVDSLITDLNGNLELHIKDEKIIFNAPTCYQMIDSERVNVNGSFNVLSKNEVGFKLGKYDEYYALVIDPVLIYSTYIGGNGHDSALGIHVDKDGNMILIGATGSTDFPVGVDHYMLGAHYFYVTKLLGNGSDFEFTTFLGGRSYDALKETAIDAEGNIYLAGYTESDDFPTKNAHQGGLAGGEGSDAFVSKIKADGSDFIYSTYLGGWWGSGGSEWDEAHDIAIDKNGNAYVTGWTGSMFFDTTKGAYQTKPGIEEWSYNGVTDAFVSKFDANGVLVYSTYLSGIVHGIWGVEPDGWGDDKGTAIAVDHDGSVFVAGLTTSDNFPKTSGTYRENLEGARPNIFISKLNPEGSDVLYSTFFGGSENSYITDMQISEYNSISFCGYTNSDDFPTTHSAFQENFIGANELPQGYEYWDQYAGKDGFITVFNKNLVEVLYSTYFGGNNWERVYRIDTDDKGKIYGIGTTFSTDLPTTDDALIDTLGGAMDPFVIKIDFLLGGDETLDYSTYFGGKNIGGGNDISIDDSRNFYVAGWTRSDNILVTENALQDSLEGSQMPDGEPFGDAFVAKIGRKDYIRFAAVYPHPSNDLWLPNTLRPGEEWQFNISVKYALFASNIGDIDILIEDDKGNILASQQIQNVPNADGLFYNNNVMNKIIVPNIEDSDSLFLRAFLTPDNHTNPIDSAVVAYKIVVHEWTFMIYMNGDGNLEHTAIKDLAEMGQVGSNDSLAIVLLLDRHEGYYDGWGDWSDSRYMAIRENEIKERSMGELDMGHPRTLLNFVNWAQENFPAHKYALVMWDHGGGWKSANSATLNKIMPAPHFPIDPPGIPDDYEAALDFGPDETSNNKLQGREIKIALQRIPKLDILFFNTCVYALIENSYNYRHYANFYIASQDFMPLQSMPYKAFLQSLKDRPEMTSAEVGKLAVDLYGDSYPVNQKNITLSATYLHKAEQIASEVNGLALELMEKQPWDAIDSALVKTRYYPPKHFRDLYHFAENLKEESNDPEIVLKCDRIMGSINDATVANYASIPEEGSHGTSIYFPKSIGAAHPWYFSTKTYEFAEKNHWDDFLLLYLYRNILPQGVEGPVLDSYEVNNTFSQAHGPLASNEVYYSYIPYAGDEDFYFFTTGRQTPVTIKLTSPQGINYDLTVMDANQQILTSSNSTDQIDSLYIASVQPGNYYLQVQTNNNFFEHPYKLELVYDGEGIGQVPLSFDDGSPADGMYSNDAGEVIGSNFRAPLYPMELNEVSFYLNSTDGAGAGGDGSFYVWLADFYGTKTEPFLVTPKGLQKISSAQLGGWFTVDLSDKNIVLQTDFFVGVGYDGQNTPVLGMDNFDDGRAFRYDDSTQTWRALPQTAFIRAKASYLESPETVILSTVEKSFGLPGEIISLPVEITNIPSSGIDSVNFEINYNPHVLTFNNLGLEDGLLSDWSIMKMDTSFSGKLGLNLHSGTAVSDSGKLFNLYFQIDNSASIGDSSEIRFERILLNGGIIFNTVPEGKIIVGNTTDVIESEVEQIPKKFALYQNYPNPFNPNTTIKYSVPKQCDVVIKIFDMLGKEVAIIVNKKVTPGIYSAEFNVSNLATGIYFFRIQAGEYVETKKMVYLK